MRYASRMERMDKSFIREILKVTQMRDMISFAGGLPNARLFPTDEISEATQKVLASDGENVLQYSTTEGHPPLRDYIAQRYYGDCGITGDNILIVNGSQQGLDLIGKVMLDPGDTVLMERPGYLGAIQAFSVFEPRFLSVKLNLDGVDISELETILESHSPKLFYAVTNFQNPTGLTYTPQIRERCAAVLKGRDTLMIEDNPYGELRFMGQAAPPMVAYLGDGVVSLGSFSKIFAPAFRLGWICGSAEIIDKLVSVKQASDLHSNYFAQRVLYQYLVDNDIDQHISLIRAAYKEQRDCMVEVLRAKMPSKVAYTEPEGGMFIWLTLPEGISSMKLLEATLPRNVAFVPGVPFYADTIEQNTLRLNYTNSEADDIERGLCVLAEEIAALTT